MKLGAEVVEPVSNTVVHTWVFDKTGHDVHQSSFGTDIVRDWETVHMGKGYALDLVG